MNRNYMIYLAAFLSCCFCLQVQAFDDADTHPRLTNAATKNDNIKRSLIAFTGYSSGFEKVFKGINSKGVNKDNTALQWLQEGSTDEDALNICRASNHFHNPIHSGDWLASQMSDSVWVDVLCGTTKRYSAVTWATGYKSPADYIGARTGQYLYLTGLSDVSQNMGWDDARVYLYSALTSEDPAAREAQFVRTFKAVGQVMHLL